MGGHQGTSKRPLSRRADNRTRVNAPGASTLIDRFESQHGRLVFFRSIAHEPTKSPNKRTADPRRHTGDGSTVHHMAWADTVSSFRGCAFRLIRATVGAGISVQHYPVSGIDLDVGSIIQLDAIDEAPVFIVQIR